MVNSVHANSVFTPTFLMFFYNNQGLESERKKKRKKRKAGIRNWVMRGHFCQGTRQGHRKREIFAGWRREGENSAEHKICDNATIAGVRSQSRCLEETVLANYSTVSVNRRELFLSIPITQKSEQQNRRRFTSLLFSLSREPSTGYPPPPPPN